jgi:hypothetical protein
VTIKVLRRLHQSSIDGTQLAPMNAPRVSDAQLSRRAPTYTKAERSAHYEQLGLWLARYSTILVAVCGPESADIAYGAKLGGTARVIAFRRTATPDATAAGVIVRSSELLTPSPLEEPDGGHVLWIYSEVRPPGGGHLRSVDVLRPIQRVFDLRRVDVSFEHARAAIYQAPTDDHLTHLDPTDTREARCKGALTVPLAFERFHHRQGCAKNDGTAACAGPEHPVDYLRMVRNDGPLSTQQTGAAAWTRLAQRWCAFLFLLAVGSYEASIEVVRDQPVPLLIYLVLLAIIWFIAALIRHRKIQLRAEDYRGLCKMMRVQIVWWATGIDRMVDRVHMRTIDTDLRLVREAAATIGMWALLRCNRMAGCDVNTFRPGGGTPRKYPSRMEADRWIGTQVTYFTENARAQFGAKRLAEVAFDTALLTALVGLLALGAIEVVLGADGREPTLKSWLEEAYAWALIAFPVVTGLCAMGALWVATGHPLGSDDRVARRRIARDQAPKGPKTLSTRAEASLSNLWHVPIRMLVSCLILSVLLIGMQIGRRFSECVAQVLPNEADSVLPWLGPAAFLLPLMFTLFLRIPDRVIRFDVRRLDVWQRAASVLLVVALYVTAVVFAPVTVAFQQEAEHSLAVAFRSLVLVQAVLLLASAGMIRWYTERRNHLPHLMYPLNWSPAKHRNECIAGG